MGKAKKSKLKKQTSKPYARSPHPSSKQKANKVANTHKSLPPIIPFSPTDRILTVGEGDFSFSHSLITAHGCTSVIATGFDKASVVTSKYTGATSHIRPIEADEGCKVIYGVDATKLGKSGAPDGGGKDVKKGGFGRIIFNFPHVGGLTKDVNRQVRHNQQLLVGFFESAIPLLAPNGTIVVTIFEGEPYDLWNIRDLARHVRLTVTRSFAFQASAYPGYKHARTLGDIEGGGGWKGNDRRARTYIFEVNDGRTKADSNRTSKENNDEMPDDD